jgi:hypothetical protein
MLHPITGGGNGIEIISLYCILTILSQYNSNLENSQPRSDVQNVRTAAMHPPPPLSTLPHILNRHISTNGKPPSNKKRKSKKDCANMKHAKQLRNQQHEQQNRPKHMLCTYFLLQHLSDSQRAGSTSPPLLPVNLPAMPRHATPVVIRPCAYE